MSGLICIAKRVVLLSSLMAVLVASGCGDEPVSVDPAEIIKKASAAVQAPQTFHFLLETQKLGKPAGIWLTKAEGDVMKPDKMVGKMSVLYSGLPLAADVVVDGKSQYWTDPLNKRWMVMPGDFNVAQLFDPAKGVSDILTNLKSPQSDGSEKVGNADTFRLKGAVPPDALRAISGEVNVKADVPITIWVGQSDFLLRRVRLQGPLIEGEPQEVERVITISDYDKAVKIETPVLPK